MTSTMSQPGQRVNYHAIIGGPVTSTGHIVLTTYPLGHGEVVARITGKSGCVALDALTPAIEETSNE